jgi:hypothetical protein
MASQDNVTIEKRGDIRMLERMKDYLEFIVRLSETYKD